MSNTVLIIGKDLTYLATEAVSDAASIDAEAINADLDRAISRLESAGVTVTLLFTRSAETVEDELADLLRKQSFDVIVVGSGLRTTPYMTIHFERLLNVLHARAPQAKIAFASSPGDSDQAALRWIPHTDT